MSKYLFILAIALFNLSLSAQKTIVPIYLKDATENSKLADIKVKFDRFKQQMIGHFSNKDQIQNDGQVQEFIAIPIMQERTNEFWVYVEHFLPNIMDAPIDQRIEQFIRVSPDSIRVEVYSLNDPNKYINEWKKPTPFAGLTKNDFSRDAACDLVFVSNENIAYEYSTPSNNNIGCEVKGKKGAAQYMSLSYKVNDNGHEIVLDLYDKDKKMVKKGDLVLFERLNYKAIGYVNYAPDVKAPKTKKPKKEKTKK